MTRTGLVCDDASQKHVLAYALLTDVFSWLFVKEEALEMHPACPQSCPQGLQWLPPGWWSHSAVFLLFQMDVDEDTAEKFYEKLLELEEQTLEKYRDLLD